MVLNIDTRLTACVSGLRAGVDSAWEQEKPKARKMLVNRAESRKSTARFVGWRYFTEHNHLAQVHNLLYSQVCKSTEMEGHA